MDFVIAAPAYVQAAATDLANIGSSISSANAMASTPTTSILAAGADTVSMELAALFGIHGQMYQALSAQAAMFHTQFVELMNGGGAQYALAEAANASPLQALEGAINAPVSLAMGRPLVGDGASGATAGPAGQSGGWLYGNGAPGGSGANGVAAPLPGNHGVAGGNGCTGGLLAGNGGARAISGVGNATPLAAVPAGGYGGSGGRGGLLFSVGGDGAVGGVGGLTNSGTASSAVAGIGGLGGLGGYSGNGGSVSGSGGDSGAGGGVDTSGKDAVSGARGGSVAGAGGDGGDGGRGGLRRGGGGTNARFFGNGDHGGDGFYPGDSGGGTKGLLSDTPGSPAATT